jgi:hypothetical protein
MQQLFGFHPDFRVGDTVRMTVPRGNKYTSVVKEVLYVDGVQHVRFCIDWDEGPATYTLPVTQVERLGYEEGDVCGRDGCTGIIEEREVENCSCHISPPCAQCVEDRTYCPECGWRGKDEE